MATRLGVEPRLPASKAFTVFFTTLFSHCSPDFIFTREGVPCKVSTHRISSLLGISSKAFTELAAFSLMYYYIRLQIRLETGALTIMLAGYINIIPYMALLASRSENINHNTVSVTHIRNNRLNFVCQPLTQKCVN